MRAMRKMRDMTLTFCFSCHIFIILCVSDIFVKPAERFGAGVISVCAGMAGVCFVVFAYIVARALLLDRR